MTTQGRLPWNSSSGQPGGPMWYKSIRDIKRELDANNGRLIKKLAEQEAEKAEEVRPLIDMAETLRVAELFSAMNDTLLGGEGKVQTVIRWEEGADFTGEDEDGWDDEDEDRDGGGEEEEEGRLFLFVVLSVILTWKEAGRLQIKVDIQDEDDGIEVHVNGWPANPPTARNLQNALVRAFREQMDEEYGKFDEE